MRILEAVSQQGKNGAISYARQIIRLLHERGHEIWLAASADSWIAQETAGEARLIATDFARWPLRELRRVAGLCRAEGIQVTHSHLTRSANFCAVLRRLHGIPSVGHGHSAHFRLHWYAHDLVVAVSGATLRAHQRRLAARGRRGVVLHNFVDGEKFSPVAADAASHDLRATLGLPADAPIVLQVGDISPRKGHLQAVRAAGIVAQAVPGVRFVFIGGRNCSEKYLRQIETETVRGGAREALIWAGPRTDVAHLLPGATVALLPSLDEPFSLAGLEAMACGVPLVASRVGGFPEMIVQGKTGLVVPSCDSGALATALIELLRNSALRAAMSAAARTRALTEFTAQAHIVQLERHLLRVVSEHTRRDSRDRAP